MEIDILDFSSALRKSKTIPLEEEWVAYNFYCWYIRCYVSRVPASLFCRVTNSIGKMEIIFTITIGNAFYVTHTSLIFRRVRHKQTMYLQWINVLKTVNPDILSPIIRDHDVLETISSGSTMRDDNSRDIIRTFCTVSESCEMFISSNTLSIIILSKLTNI